MIINNYFYLTYCKISRIVNRVVNYFYAMSKFLKTLVSEVPNTSKHHG